MAKLSVAILGIAVFTVCTPAYAGTMKPTFVNTNKETATDLHISFRSPTKITAGEPANRNDREGEPNRHTWYNLSIAENQEIQMTIESEKDIKFKYYWTTGGTAEFEGTMLGSDLDQGDIKLSFSPSVSTGDGQVLVHAGGTDNIFNSIPGLFGDAQASAFGLFLDGLARDDGRPLIYAFRPDSTSVEFFNLILAEPDVLSAVLLKQDSTQTITISAVPEPSTWLFFGLGIILFALIRRRNRINGVGVR
jgi:hypothetical protein